MIAGLVAQIDNDNIAATIAKVRGWPVYVGRPRGYQLPDLDPLSNRRDSFRGHFDVSGLPPAPT